MRILLVHSDNRQFEAERFGAAWVRGGGDRDELVPVTPSTAAAGASQEQVAGLILTGGPDVEPARYGAIPEPGVELEIDAPRDALDFGLLGRAQREGWPVLAVCYGMQLLNVAHGGTLIQDLERAGIPGHRVPEPKDFLAHSLRIDTCSAWLAGLPTELAVNSRHHQGIARVGEALEVVATAPDGLVEAVELRDRERLVLGVQWHPENIAAPAHDEVFRRLRDAARRFAGSRRAG